MILSHINNIRSLEELSKYDSIIRVLAKTLTKCPDTADDLVQNAYLSLNKAFLNNKVINGGYIALTLNNLYKNHLRFNVNRYDFGNKDYPAVIPDEYDDSIDTIYIKELQETQYLEIEKRINTLSWYERKLFELSQEKSLSQISRETKISYKSLIYSNNKIKQKLKL